MKNIALTLAALLVILVSHFSAASEHLADVHKEKGITCMDCHKTDKPTKAASVKACKGCHGEKVAIPIVKIEAREVDFHESPHGTVRCTHCHKAHTDSVMYCNQCHTFNNIKVP